MNTIKNLVNVMAVSMVAIIVLNMGGVVISDAWYSVLGLTWFICVAWLAVVVNKK